MTVLEIYHLVDIDEVYLDGNGPLHTHGCDGCEKGHDEIVRLLLMNNAKKVNLQCMPLYRRTFISQPPEIVRLFADEKCQNRH
jgi:hypothetical protein